MTNEFLPGSRPWESFTKLDGGKEVLTFTAGLARITETHGGINIIPTVYPTFEMSGAGKFDMPVPWARDLAKKLLEWCDTADKMNAAL